MSVYPAYIQHATNANYYYNKYVQSVKYLQVLIQAIAHLITKPKIINKTKPCICNYHDLQDLPLKYLQLDEEYINCLRADYRLRPQQLARSVCTLLNTKNSKPRVFMDISIDRQAAERIIIELETSIVPITSNNFMQLCTGEHEYGYQGCTFFRIFGRSIILAGDITNGDRTGGKSSSGVAFDDQNFTLKHDGKGVVSMANSGPNSNSSQFFIELKENSCLDGTNVVFGHVLKQCFLVLDKIGSTRTSSQGVPSKEIKIVKSGRL